MKAFEYDLIGYFYYIIIIITNLVNWIIFFKNIRNATLLIFTRNALISALILYFKCFDLPDPISSLYSCFIWPTINVVFAISLADAIFNLIFIFVKSHHGHNTRIKSIFHNMRIKYQIIFLFAILIFYLLSFLMYFSAYIGMQKLEDKLLDQTKSQHRVEIYINSSNAQ